MSNAKDTLEQALGIISNEVGKLEKLANYPNSISDDDTPPLDKQSSTILTDYIKALVLVRKDDRDAAKGENLGTKSDDELNALAKEALKYLNINDKGEDDE